MPGTITPGQMFDNELNAVKGWPSPYAIDKSLELNSGVTDVVRGSCLSIDPATGRFRLGTAGDAVAIFALQGQNEFDANSDVGNISGGKLSGLVALGSYELETSEFDAGSFPPNTPLRSGTDGKLEVGTIASDNIVGVASDGVFTNENGKSVLRFWPTWLPGAV